MISPLYYIGVFRSALISWKPAYRV